VLLYDDILPPLAALLRAEGYVQTRSFFHAHVAVDRRQYALLLFEQRAEDADATSEGERGTQDSQQL
jgi:hypothetical protein